MRHEEGQRQVKANETDTGEREMKWNREGWHVGMKWRLIGMGWRRVLRVR